jgi:sialidase-1
VIYSDDHGRTWHLGGSVGPHTNECQVAELSDGSLLINCRNHWARSGSRPDLAFRRITARSPDAGQTWSAPQFAPTLIEPQCQASLIRYSWPDQTRSRLLFSNPASKSGRQRMTVRLSHDEGKTWPESKLIHEGSSAYSSLAALPDGRVGLLYERDNYSKMTFASFTLAWLTGR